MNQILNIFRKDTRRFWPEILLSVVITFAFAFSAPNQWKVFHFPSDRQRMQTIVVALAFLMVTGWWLLIARVVHEETLVGDRQFWITRPYEWQKLLAAKVLFAVAWIGVPFLLSQSLMLAEAGYSPLGCVPGMLLCGLLMSTVFLLPLFSVAAVTQNFARLTLTLLASLVVFVGYDFLMNQFPSGTTSANPYANRLLYPLLFCGCALAITLQYATRRAWVSRGLLLVLPFLLVASVGAYSRQSLVDRAYPQPAAASIAPISIAHDPDKHYPDNARSYQGQDDLDILVRYSGVAEGYAVVTDDLKFTLTAADGSQWTSPWQRTHARVSPSGTGSWLTLQISPAVYDRFKSGPVTLHITFALDRYQADSVATMPYPAREQAVPGVGICASDGSSDNLLCRSPSEPRFTHVNVMWSNDPCSGSPTSPGDTRPGEGWYEPGNRDFVLTSVWPSRLFLSGDYYDNSHWHVCPGSPLTVTQYHLVDRTQAGFTLTTFVLPAYVQPT
jgi:hypothetical protein